LIQCQVPIVNPMFKLSAEKVSDEILSSSGKKLQSIIF
jgi:hypothetical protein